ncbi:hypothetical protein GPALN_015633 [Globodera pallida]|nr:hypothetical protein GPALN_015633 [Globodera pallida]
MGRSRSLAPAKSRFPQMPKRAKSVFGTRHPMDAAFQFFKRLNDARGVPNITHRQMDANNNNICNRQASSDETWSEDDVKAVPLIAAPRRRLVIEGDDEEEEEQMEH